MDKAGLIQAMRTQRQRWVPVAAGKRVQILLPTELEVIRRFMKLGEGGNYYLAAEFEEVKAFTTNWEGFTEADLLGASIGSADLCGFDPELWDLLVADHTDWLRTVAQALLEGISERMQLRAQDAKN
jgi:hypothetical protein